MTWTTTPPTEPGYYWWRVHQIGKPVIVEIYISGDIRMSRDRFGDCPDTLRKGEWWGERIPEPPKEGE